MYSKHRSNSADAALIDVHTLRDETVTGARMIRCLLGMLGTDVHSKGIRTLASWLRDQGIEVVYVGEHNTVEAMVNALLQEDADLLGLSFSSSGYLAYVERVALLMREKGIGDVPIMVGGQIHPNDHAALRSLGVSGIFGAGTTKSDVLDYIQGIAANRARGYPTRQT